MKTLILVLAAAVALAGCSTHYTHQESLTVDHFGATGTYSDSRSGKLAQFSLIGGGGGGGGGGAGAGALALVVDSSQSQSDPRNFAKSVVMVDLSKKLKSVKVDEVEGIRDYEYVQPISQASAKRSSFGYQPVK